MSDYYLRFAAAFVRGSRPESLGPLSQLSDEECERLMQQGRAEGLRLHRFKRAAELPRVRKVLGTLRALAPDRLLDIGTGRGVFLWPLLDEFPQMEVTCVDRLDYRVQDLLAVRRGGVERLQALQAEIPGLPFEDRAFPVVTALEVIEHIADPRAALAEVCRLADRAVLLSVPSKPDDNPEHLHLFTPGILEGWLKEAGMRTVKWDAVLNHHLGVALR